MAKRKALNDSDDTVDPSTSSSFTKSQTPVKTRRIGERETLSSKTNIISHKEPIIDTKRISSNFTLTQFEDFDASQISQFGKKNCNSDRLGGSIEKISLKNFKCHSSLEFSFHKYINFILGRNGSGKSAVMDAVILCLGGKANNTGRQASAKTFIKTNCDKAELSLTIRNEGEEAYKTELYGSKITIERRLSRDGSSHYRLLNENNKVVSNKKKELDNIVDVFNIQVENPVCFLNQETSKHFLNSSRPTDKYQLFMKASQLESMKNLMELTEKERQSSKLIIEQKKSGMPKLEEELFEWEEKFKKCQSVEKLRKKLDLLMIECSWSFVIKWENEMVETNRQKQKIAKSKEKHEQKLAEAQAVFQNDNNEHNQANCNLKEIHLLIKNSSGQKNELEDALKKASSEYKMKQNEYKKCSAFMEKMNKDKKEWCEKLQEEKSKLQINHDEKRIEKEEKIKQIKQKLNDAINLEKARNNDVKMFNDNVENSSRQINDKQLDIFGVEKRTKGLKGEIENLIGSSKNQVLVFGTYMLNLVNDIKTHFNAKKFREMPKGPLGLCIQPKNYQWSLAIEQCLGGIMTSFICGNYDDEKLLHSLINKHVNNHNKPRVIVADFNTPLYDVRRFRPENKNYPTVYEMLNIKDNVVANTLFDIRKIESVLLLPDIEVGQEVIERNSTEKCSEAFLMNGDQLQGRPTFRMYSCKKKSAIFFTQDNQQAIEMKKKELEVLIQQVEKKKQELKEHTDEMNKSKMQRAQHEKQLDVVKKEVFNLKQRLKEAESIVIPQPENMDIFEDELKKVENEIEELKPKLEEMEEMLHRLKSNFDKASQDFTKYDNEMAVHFKRLDEIKTKFNELEQKKVSNETAIQHYKQLLDKVVQEEAAIDKTLESQETELKKLLKSAEEVGSRVLTKRTSVAIENEIKAIEKQIEQSKKLNGNVDLITEEYYKRRTKFDQIKQEIHKQTAFLKKLKKALEDRTEATNTFTQGKALRCSVSFTNYLTSRDFTGRLKFDHENQTLDIIVDTNKSRDSKGSKDIRSLSGGERSFSTVAFLLSLWSIVESPILFLDEFDVFMDQVNRSFAMELILSAAKEKITGQYVFLTPQEMGSIKPDEYVKMFKMPDPKRAIDLPSVDENQENE